jgi:flagellar basal-body rod modification protein FlgD
MAGLSATDLARLNGTDTGSASTRKTSDAGSEERFLKLLVAQMQNQDPLNPMDNAAVTSQVAQINTVGGIEKLNKTVESLSSQFGQMQVMQGAALVGRDVIVPGDKLTVDSDKVGHGAFELASPADSVTVEILSPSGQVVDTVNMGAQKSGQHSFKWNAGSATNDSALRFRVKANLGTATPTTTPLMLDRVAAINTGGDTLTLELVRSGNVPYSTVRAFN